MARSVRKSSLPRLGSFIGLLVLLVGAPLALAAEGEPTREEYVKEVDVICKKSEKTNSRILKGVKRQITKKEQLIPAGKRFIRASKSFGRAVAQIAKVPQPGSDKPKLSRWLKKLYLERDMLKGIGQALTRKQKGRASKLSVRLQDANRDANRIVFSFEFDYCDREVNFG